MSFTKAALKRIASEVRALRSEEERLEGIYYSPDEEQVGVGYALIRGPEDTPYHRGLFFFEVAFPFDYPLSPPRVHIMTTDGGRVRFGPNLYSCGKVCLSILGTWTGPPWTASMDLTTVLLSVQSLLSKNPMYNEPGMGAPTPVLDPTSSFYDSVVEHECLRVSIVQNLQTILHIHSGRKTAPRFMPAELREAFCQNVSRDRGAFSSLIVKYNLD